MTRPTRLTMGIIGTFVFLFLLAVIVVKVVFTKDRILALITPQLERLISRPVRITDAGITLWGGIGVRLEGVVIGNAPGFSNDPMMSVGTLDIKARFWPLLSGRAVVDRIVIDEPYALVEYDNNGRSNFDGILKSHSPDDSAASAGSGQRLSVAAITVDDARFAWRDMQAGRWFDLFGGAAEVNVNATNPQIPSFIAELTFDSLIAQADHPLAIRSGRPSIYARGSWDKTSRTLAFDSTLFKWWGAKLAASGQVRFSPSLYEIGVNARLASVRVEELIHDIDSAFPLPKLANLTASMSGNIEARLVWPLPENTVPDWQGRFELVDVKWPLPQTGAVVTLPRIEIRGGDRSISWAASSGQITGGTFSTSGTIDQLFQEEKTFSARLKANMPLEGTRGLLPESWKAALAGALNLDITGFGSVDNWKELNLNGRISSDRMTFTDADWDFDSLSVGLDCQFVGQGLKLDRCEWAAGESRGTVTGNIDGIIPSVLSGFTTPDIPHGQFDVASPHLNLDQLLGDDTSSIPSTDGQAHPENIPILSIIGNLTADTLIYNRLLITAAQCPYSYKDRVFSLSPISGEVLGGTLDGRLDWNLNTWPEPEFFTSISADSIESNDFFARYLGWAGEVLGQISLSGEFSGRGRVASQILPTLLARGRIDLSEARLETAPLLAQVSRSIGIAGLDRPRSLRELRLPFRIENGRVITDDLRVSWDDVDYSARGSFGLDKSIAYSVSATAADDRAPRVVQGAGLKFVISGTVTEPAVTIDAAGTARGVIDNAVDLAKDTVQKALDQKLKDFLTPRKP